MEDRLRRTAPAKSAAAAAGSGEEGSGGDEAAPKERMPPTHSLWMLSRKFVRLLLTTQVPTCYTPSLHNPLLLLFRPCGTIYIPRQIYANIWATDDHS